MGYTPNFIHEERFQPYEIESVTTEQGRKYWVPDASEPYESVTTALGNQPGKKQAIQEWRNRVGFEEANRISRIATTRGTAVHSIIEDYLDNKPDYLENRMPDAVVMFKTLQPILDKAISKVYMQESPLWSHKYRLAGRVDCVAEVNGKLTVVDFKTSMKPKKRDWITDYYLQTAAYSHMIHELYGEMPSQTVIFIAVQDSSPQIFVGDPNVHIQHSFFKERL